MLITQQIYSYLVSVHILTTSSLYPAHFAPGSSATETVPLAV